MYGRISYMGAKNILLTGDLAKCIQVQGAILIPFAVGPITSSATSSDTERAICVDGDEGKVVFAPCGYTTPTFPIPGVVLCKITELDSSHYSKYSTHDGKKILLVGSGSFKTKCTVTIPASAPTVPPSLDTPGKSYSGTGSFTEVGPHTCEEL